MIAIENERTAIRGKPLPAQTWIHRVREGTQGMHDFEIQITTGVMHQIRCHLASQGWPILGDPIYRGNPSSRLWLHAWKLEIPLASGARLALQSTLPVDWSTPA
jgi:23S rRNA-/tRNA-specific pseudouridylate synthase